MKEKLNPPNLVDSNNKDQGDKQVEINLRNISDITKKIVNFIISGSEDPPFSET